MKHVSLQKPRETKGSLAVASYVTTRDFSKQNVTTYTTRTTATTSTTTSAIIDASPPADPIAANESQQNTNVSYFKRMWPRVVKIVASSEWVRFSAWSKSRILSHLLEARSKPWMIPCGSEFSSRKVLNSSKAAKIQFLNGRLDNTKTR